MKYLILVRSAEQMDPQLADEMVRAGVHVASEGLADPALARWISVRGGEHHVSEKHGADDQLSGFYLIDCPGWDEAVRWAAKVPDAAYRQVELRPVLDMSGWEF
jgi:hypothetical protein